LWGEVNLREGIEEVLILNHSAWYELPKAIRISIEEIYSVLKSLENSISDDCKDESIKDEIDFREIIEKRTFEQFESLSSSSKFMFVVRLFGLIDDRKYWGRSRLTDSEKIDLMFRSLNELTCYLIPSRAYISDEIRKYVVGLIKNDSTSLAYFSKVFNVSEATLLYWEKKFR